MNLLVGLIPALAWGVLPLVVTKIGGRPVNQILGTTFGTLLVAFIVWLFVQPALSGGQFVLTVLSGAAWAMGQYLQYVAFQRVGVAKAMPISTGLQLVGTSLLGVVAFGEWSSRASLIVGLVALVVIVIGIVLTTIDSRSTSAMAHGSVWSTVGLFALSTVGYVGYSALPRVANVSGWQGFLPQGLGMAATALVVALVMVEPSALRQRVTWLSLVDGLIFSVAALTYLISAQKNGIATGFTLSQMNVVLATLGGIVLLHERRSPRGLAWTLIGLALVVIGGVMIGNMTV